MTPEKSNVIPFPVEKKEYTFNEKIGLLWKSKNYEEHPFLAHFYFIVDGKHYTFSSVELCMLGVI